MWGKKHCIHSGFPSWNHAGLSASCHPLSVLSLHYNNTQLRVFLGKLFTLVNLSHVHICTVNFHPWHSSILHANLWLQWLSFFFSWKNFLWYFFQYRAAGDEFSQHFLFVCLKTPLFAFFLNDSFDWYGTVTWQVFFFSSNTLNVDHYPLACIISDENSSVILMGFPL